MVFSKLIVMQASLQFSFRTFASLQSSLLPVCSQALLPPPAPGNHSKHFMFMNYFPPHSNSVRPLPIIFSVLLVKKVRQWQHTGSGFEHLARALLATTNLSAHQNPWKGFLEHGQQGPFLRIPDSLNLGWVPKSNVSNKFLLMLLVRGPCFDNHRLI